MDKRLLKRVARIYAGSILIQQDGGFADTTAGITEDDKDYVLDELHKIGES